MTHPPVRMNEETIAWQIHHAMRTRPSSTWPDDIFGSKIEPIEDEV